MKFAKNLDGFSLDQVLKISLVLAQYEHVSDEFWELAQFVIEDKIDQFEEFLNGDDTQINISRTYPFGDKLEEAGLDFFQNFEA